jgi:hypothetical protein
MGENSVSSGAAALQMFLGAAEVLIGFDHILLGLLDDFVPFDNLDVALNKKFHYSV